MSKRSEESTGSRKKIVDKADRKIPAQERNDRHVSNNPHDAPVKKDLKTIFSRSNKDISDFAGFLSGMDRLTRIIPSSFRKRFSETIRMKFNFQDTISWDEYGKKINGNAMVFTVKAKEMGGNIGIVLRGDVVYYFLEIMLGGKNVDPGMRVDRPTFTKFERDSMSGIIDNIVSSLHTAFNEICSVYFSNPKYEENIDYISSWGPNDFVSWLEGEVFDGEGRGGYIDIVVPHDSIQNEKLRYAPSTNIIDEDYRSLMYKIVEDLSVVLRVEMNSLTLFVSELNNLKKGDTIMLNRTEKDKANMVIGDTLVGHVELGRVAGNLAAHIIEMY